MLVGLSSRIPFVYCYHTTHEQERDIDGMEKKNQEMIFLFFAKKSIQSFFNFQFSLYPVFCCRLTNFFYLNLDSLSRFVPQVYFYYESSSNNV